MSLRARLMVGVVALASAGLAAANAATYAALRSFLYARVDQQLEAAQVPVLRGLAFEGRWRRPPPGPPALTPAGTYGQLRDAEGDVVREVVVGDGGEVVKPSLPPALDRVGEPYTARASDGTLYRVLAQPLEGGVATLVVAIPLREVQQTLARLVGIEVAVSLAVLGAMAGMSWWVVRLGLRPLEEMAATAAEIAKGDLARRVARADGRTEVGRLGLALNAMLAQIEQAFAERKASEEKLRRFLADASHELRTPLTSIRGYAELFRRGAASRPDDLAKAMSRIEQESARMGVLVEDLLLLARLDQGRPLQRAPVDLAAVAADAVADARATDPARPITLQAPEPVVILGDEVRLRQVAANLLSNALTHTPDGSPVEVSVSRNGADAVLAVSDHGPGLSPEEAERVFERFYRSDPSRARDRGGAGLGLSIVAAIAKAHGGRVEVDTAPGRGATFRVHLPLAPQAGG